MSDVVPGDRRRIELDLSDLDPDPFLQFGRWFEDAKTLSIKDPNAMTLATAGADGVPSARTVLLKGFDRDGFVFFTNHGSRKGRELAANPHAALVFYWPLLDRQVNVRGAVVQVSPEESNEYWVTRPRGSQLGAWASRQTEEIESRDVLIARLAEVTERFEGGDVPLPDFWGGFRVTPVTIEFWQGRLNRLHDRFRYARTSEGWTISRLSP